MNTDITNAQKAIIHILKDKYGITDDEYRNLLRDKYLSDSCKLLSFEQAEEFIHYLNLYYNDDYKNGFQKALYKIFNREGINKIETLIEITSGKEPTELELEMYNMMSHSQQQRIMSNLLERI